MGKKVNPKVMRLGIIKSWPSVWFSSGAKYIKNVEQDVTVRKFLIKTYKEAERLKIKLATMGLDSNIQKGMAGTQKWYRVNMGPYAQTDSINTIRARLRQNGIDAIITEVGDQ